MKRFKLKRQEGACLTQPFMSSSKLNELYNMEIDSAYRLSDSISVSDFHKAETAFLPSEEWARKDWEVVSGKISESDKEVLDADYIVRMIRSSGFLAQPERRARRNLDMLSQRAKWVRTYRINELMGLCQDDYLKKGKWCAFSSDRIEQFRNLVFPVKIFGFSTRGVPIVKFSLSEANWKSAVKIFRNKSELKLYVALTLQCLQEKLLATNCQTKSGDDSVTVTGKFIFILDLENANLSDIKLAYRLQLFKSIRYMSKFYPDLILKTYVIGSGHPLMKRTRMFLWPFLPIEILIRAECLSSKDLINRLLIEDLFEVGQIPVEYGGTFEGCYVISVDTD